MSTVVTLCGTDPPICQHRTIENLQSTLGRGIRKDNRDTRTPVAIPHQPLQLHGDQIELDAVALDGPPGGQANLVLNAGGIP